MNQIAPHRVESDLVFGSRWRRQAGDARLMVQWPVFKLAFLQTLPESPFLPAIVVCFFVHGHVAVETMRGPD